MEENLGAAYQLYLNSLNNLPPTNFNELRKQNYYDTNIQKVNLPDSSNVGEEFSNFGVLCDTYREQ